MLTNNANASTNNPNLKLYRHISDALQLFRTSNSKTHAQCLKYAIDPYSPIPSIFKLTGQSITAVNENISTYLVMAQDAQKLINDNADSQELNDLTTGTVELLIHELTVAKALLSIATGSKETTEKAKAILDEVERTKDVDMAKKQDRLYGLYVAVLAQER